MGLLSELGIAGQKTQMSFGPQPGQRQYNGHSLTSLFAQRRNLLKPAFWGLLSEIVRFNRLAKLALTEALDPGATLESFLARHRFSPFFARHYILPMGAAIWSSSLQEMRRFPLPLFLRFFENHGLLDIRDRPQWYVVPGGSREYVRALLAGLGDRWTCGSTRRCSRWSATRRELSCGWRPGRRILTSDLRLPLRAGAGDAGGAHRFRTRSPWGHRLAAQRGGVAQRSALAAGAPARLGQLELSPERRGSGPGLRHLQHEYSPGLPAGAPLFCVTLNPDAPVDDRYVWQRFVYEHPLFNPQSWSAQLRREEINGQQRSWYCGAYWYNGFHEDGVRSALDVVQGIAAAEGN